MNFGLIEYSWLLTLVPLALLLGIARARSARRKLAALADHAVLPGLLDHPVRIDRSAKRHTSFLAFTTLMLVLALMRPQWGFEWKESKRRGGDIVIAVDVSDSMSAQDVPPSRIERARRKISDLLEKLHGDRVALVAFAGVAFIETPLTLDYGAYRSFLNLIQPGTIPIKGSNIELALKKSLEALGIKDGKAEVSRGAAIILLTDGEELDGDLTAYGDIAREHGVKIYVLGIGTPEGAPIPTPEGYKKDKEGRVVITRLQPDVLEKIAIQTGGTYVQSIGTPKDIEAIYNSSMQNSLTQSDRNWANSKKWHEYYQVPLALALLLLIFGPWGRIFSAFRTAALLLAVTSQLLSAPEANAETAEAIGAQAKKHFDSGDFQGAEEEFSVGHERAPDDPRMLIGLGASRYRKGDFKTAQKAFADAVNAEKDPTKKAGALYNLGNSFVQDSHYEEAIKSYESALKLNPSDQETKDNLAYAKKLLEQQKQEQKNDQQKKQQDKKNKDDKSSKQDKQNADKDDKKDKGDDQSEAQQPSDKEDEKKEAQSQSSDSSSSTDSKDKSQQDAQDQSAQSTPTPTDEENQSNSTGSQSSEQSSAEASPTPTAGSGSSSSDSSSSEAGGKSDSKTSGSEGFEKPQNGQDALDTLINSVQEKQDANNRFRMGQAMKQLKAEKRKLPDKDW